MFQRILAAVGVDPTSVQAAAQAVAAHMPGATLDSFHVEANRDRDVLDRLLQHTVDTQADLLVVGAHRHVIASRAAMLAPASVLMVPEGSEVRFDRILVPVDFSESSAHALRCATELSSGPSVIAMSVECDDDPWLDWPGDHGRVQIHLEEFVAATGIAGVVCEVEPLGRAGLLLRRDGLSPAHRIEGADVAATLVNAAQRRGASLIVMGTRGRTASASVLLGSVTEQVMQLAQCPVLALKEPGSPMNLAEAILSRLREPAPVLTAS